MYTTEPSDINMCKFRPLQWLLPLVVALLLSPISIQFNIATADDSVGHDVATPAQGNPPGPARAAENQTPDSTAPVRNALASKEPHAAAADTTTLPSSAEPSTVAAEPGSLPQLAQANANAASSTASAPGASSSAELYEGEAEVTELHGDATAEVIAEQATSQATPAEAPPEEVVDEQNDGPEAAAEVAVDSVRSLSVEPTRGLLPEDLPRWVTQQPDYQSDVHRFAVGSVPTANRAKVNSSLDEPLMARMYGYVDQQLIREPNAHHRLAGRITPDYIRKNLIDDPAGYIAELTTTEGPMYQKWVSLSVTPEQRKQLIAWHNETLQHERLRPLGVGLAAILGFVGLTHLVLRKWHGLPVSTPIRQSEPPVAGAPAPRRRRSHGLSLLLMLGLMCLIPIALSVFFVVGAKQRRYEAERASVHAREAALQAQQQAAARASGEWHEASRQLHRELEKVQQTLNQQLPRVEMERTLKPSKPTGQAIIIRTDNS